MKAIIVDDEQNARLALRGILNENFPEVEILAECSDVPQAVKCIHKHMPDIVFLDISMPGYSGLELSQFIDRTEHPIFIVYVTAHPDFAIKAIEQAAAGYILKPLKVNEIAEVLKRIKEQVPSPEVKVLAHESGITAGKIALQTGNSITVLNTNEIIYLKAAGSYTHFIITGNKKITVTKKIAEYEKLEQTDNFMRIHRSNLININKISKIVKIEGGSVEMENGDVLSISVEKKKLLLERFKDHIL